MPHLKHRLMRAASFLPEAVIRRGVWLDRRFGWVDPADGWGFWLDASYFKWCRCDRRKDRRPEGVCTTETDL